MKHFLPDQPSDVKYVSEQPASATYKTFHGGQIMIVKGDKMFDLLGREQ